MKIDTSNRKVLAARVIFAALSGLVVASSSVKWVLTQGNESMSFGDAIKKASTSRAMLAIGLGLIVTICNGCQYFDGIQDNTTAMKSRIRKYRNTYSLCQITFEAASTVILSLVSGAALGTLYQEEFKNDNNYLRGFVFVYMAAVGFTFTREVNFKFVSGISNLIKKKTSSEAKNTGLLEAEGADDTAAKESLLNRSLRTLTFLVSLALYYFLFAKNNEEIIESLFSDDSPNYSLINLIAWGAPTSFVSATFAKITSLAFSRLTEQLYAIKQDYNNDERRSALVKLFYFIAVNPLAVLSTASLFVGLRDEVGSSEYNSLGFIGKHFHYFVTPFAALSNISALAQVFNELFFANKDGVSALNTTPAPTSGRSDYGSIN